MMIHAQNGRADLPLLHQGMRHEVLLHVERAAVLPLLRLMETLDGQRGHGDIRDLIEAEMRKGILPLQIADEIVKSPGGDHPIGVDLTGIVPHGMKLGIGVMTGLGSFRDRRPLPRLPFGGRNIAEPVIVVLKGDLARSYDRLVEPPKRLQKSLRRRHIEGGKA